jgi:phage internal scaffolding protein
LEGGVVDASLGWLSRNEGDAVTKRYLYPEWRQGGVDDPTVCSEKSLTRQSDALGADINDIMGRWEKTGVVPFSGREPVFADVSSVGSFREAQEVMVRAQEGFMALPAAVRARFGNDPVAFLDFCGDAANRPELEELGLVEKTAPAVVPPAKPSEVAAVSK